MGGKNISESFSYNLADVGMIDRAKEIAHSKKQSFSKFIVCAIESQVREDEKIKNAYSQHWDASAIKAYNNKLSDDFNLSEQNKQPTLDLFLMSEREVEEIVLEINDVQLTSELARKFKKGTIATQINFNRYRRNGIR